MESEPPVKIIIGVQKAPIFSWLKKTFPIDEKITLLTYGDAIYVPFDGALTPDLRIHELNHCRQQGFNQADASNWWEKYLNEPEFRYSQELEAYREQYKFLKQHIKDRNKLFKELHRLAVDLSGPAYGKIVNYMVAIQEIRKAA